VVGKSASISRLAETDFDSTRYLYVYKLLGNQSPGPRLRPNFVRELNRET
jgi:hypothetical protein